MYKFYEIKWKGCWNNKPSVGFNPTYAVFLLSQGKSGNFKCGQGNWLIFEICQAVLLIHHSVLSLFLQGLPGFQPKTKGGGKAYFWEPDGKLQNTLF